MIFQKCCNVTNTESISVPTFLETTSNHSRLSKECYQEFCKNTDKDIVVIKGYVNNTLWYDTDAEEEYFYTKRRRKKSRTNVRLNEETSSEDISQRAANRSSSSKVLDWITMCFWKCSPGCQELGTVST